MAEEIDNLDMVQGRWKTGDADNVVVEADQVWMLGDSEVCGNLTVDLVDKEPVSGCAKIFLSSLLSHIYYHHRSGACTPCQVSISLRLLYRSL